MLPVVKAWSFEPKYQEIASAMAQDLLDDLGLGELSQRVQRRQDLVWSLSA